MRLCRNVLRNLPLTRRTWIKVVLCCSVLFLLLWGNWWDVVHSVRYILLPEYRECVHRRKSFQKQGSTDDLYVTLKRHGRLGNWMYGYASLLGIAKANGYRPYLLESHPLTYYFDITHTLRSSAQCLNEIYDPRPCAFNDKFMTLPYGNTSIDGYVQSWKYFKHVEYDVRKEFHLKGHLKDMVSTHFNKLVGGYLKENRMIISIHVRRGDVLKPEARKLGFCHAPKAYFDNAMKHMLTKFPHSAFLVLSDDIAWCRENISPPKMNDVSAPIIFSGKVAQDIDLGMMSLCNHSIISVGTFGWWGAWLANGHVVYYKDFPLPGTKLDFETVKEDYFPDDWVGISD